MKDKYQERVRKAVYSGKKGVGMEEATRRILALYQLKPEAIETILASSSKCATIVDRDGNYLAMSLFTFLEAEERKVSEILEAVVPVKEKITFEAYRAKVLCWLVEKEGMTIDEALGCLDETELRGDYDQGLCPQFAAQVLVA